MMSIERLKHLKNEFSKLPEDLLNCLQSKSLGAIDIFVLDRPSFKILLLGLYEALNDKTVRKLIDYKVDNLIGDELELYGRLTDEEIEAIEEIEEDNFDDDLDS